MHFSDDFPSSFPCAVLLNVNDRAAGQANTAWGPRQVRARSETTLQIFKLCACPLEPLNPHSAIYRNEKKSGIGNELLVSVLHLILFHFCLTICGLYKLRNHCRGDTGGQISLGH